DVVGCLGGCSRSFRSRRHRTLARRGGCSASVSTFHRGAAAHSHLLRNQVAATHSQARLGGFGGTRAGGFGRMCTGFLLSLVGVSCSAPNNSFQRTRCARREIQALEGGVAVFISGVDRKSVV